MSGEVRRRLEDAGTRPTPDPDPAFADALEARLRSVAVGLPPAHQPPPRRRGLPFGRRAARLGVVVLATALVVAVGVSNLGPGTGPGDTPTLGRPVNVVVALADGTVLEDPDGLVLPEGAVVTVGEGGSARIGDTVLAPGDVATMRDGHLDVESPATGVLVTPRPTQRPTTRPAAESPSAGPDETAAPSGSPGRTPRPTPRPTDPPGTTSGPATAAPSATAVPAVLRPRLRARLITGPRIAVTWTQTLRAAGYVLVVTRSRNGPASNPVYPGSRVLGEFTAAPGSPLRYRVPDGVVEVRLMVVALRRDGSVLRRSQIVTVTIPATSATTGSGSGGSPLPTGTGPDPTPAPSATPGPSGSPVPS